jgi:hypothetical protein
MSAVYHKLVDGNLSQNWSNSSLLDARNDWSDVPSIQGFSTIFGAGNDEDPRDLLGESRRLDIATDVFSSPSQFNPNTGNRGGVSEFQDFGIVGLAGGGNANAPNLVIYLDTTGVGAPVTLNFDVQDLDSSSRDSEQPLNVQYRIGETGSWSNLADGYFADVTSASATPTTHVSLTLPPEVLGQPQLQIRIMTTDADGRDEWIGIDNIVVACFLRGTLIRTPQGEVPVETLSIGDEVSTHDGSSKPIKWIGHRAFARKMLKDHSPVTPVLVRAGALADNVPCRDLRLSPEHALYLDGVLVPAGNLVNGHSIVRELPATKIEYFHIEVKGQAIVIADGAPTETYLNHNNRRMFANWAEYLAVYGEDEVKLNAAGDFDRVYPCVTSGPELEAIRNKLALRSGLKADLAA